MLEFKEEINWTRVQRKNGKCICLLEPWNNKILVQFQSTDAKPDELRQIAEKLDELNKSEIFHDAEGRN